MSLYFKYINAIIIAFSLSSACNAMAQKEVGNKQLFYAVRVNNISGDNESKILYFFLETPCGKGKIIANAQEAQELLSMLHLKRRLTPENSDHNDCP